MDTRFVTIGLAALFIAASVSLPLPASAQNVRRDAGISSRSERSVRPSMPQRSRIDGTRTPSRSNGTSSRSSATPNLDQLGQLKDVLGALGKNRNGGRDRNDRYGDYGNRYDRGGSDRAYADAYRDVGIANAIVSLVGVIVSADANNRAYQPSGYVEQQQVLIKEGYYEEVRVWVPDVYNSRTHETITGHYEIHRRWVPEVYGYRDVWVPK